MSTASSLPVGEFVERRDEVAKALVTDGVDALILEPGYHFQYLANISQQDWEVWEPEERPFLMIVQPVPSPNPHMLEASGTPQHSARTTFLVPSFEAARARLLNMPFLEPLNLITYEEHWDPYLTLLNSIVFSNSSDHDRPRPSVIVGDEMRDFISRGLQQAGFSGQGMVGSAVEKVRMRKTQREVGILRAVNTGTVEAVRAMRKCLKPGLSEAEVKLVLDNTLRAGGLEPFFDIVLFDENASNPHGGTNGSKILEAETFVLIDVGAHLYGYSSDICRTFFPSFLPKPLPESPVPGRNQNSTIQEKLKVFDLVYSAQYASLTTLFTPNTTAASIDLAARSVISASGYGTAFTHRIGHGIGIKAHEPPYLHKGNIGTRMEPRMVMTLEPGVYLEGKFGMRTEDVVLVGEGVFNESRSDRRWVDVLSGERASSPWDP